MYSKNDRNHLKNTIVLHHTQVRKNKILEVPTDNCQYYSIWPPRQFNSALIEVPWAKWPIAQWDAIFWASSECRTFITLPNRPQTQNSSVTDQLITHKLWMDGWCSQSSQGRRPSAIISTFSTQSAELFFIYTRAHIHIYIFICLEIKLKSVIIPLLLLMDSRLSPRTDLPCFCCYACVVQYFTV